MGLLLLNRSSIDMLGKAKVVLTDLRGILTPFEYLSDESGKKYFSFCERDFLGLRDLIESGIKVHLRSDATIPVVSRLRRHAVEIVESDTPLTSNALTDFLAANQCDPSELVYLTNDIYSIRALSELLLTSQVTLCTAADAAEAVRLKADYVSHRNAGQGVLWEVADEILSAKNETVPAISFVIPAYNEEERIPETLDRYYHYFQREDLSFEIIVVLNGCRDNTLEVVSSFSKRHPKVRYLDIEKPIGKGGAILKGFRIARGSYISFTDADGSTYAKELVGLLNSIGDYDGIIASRWLEESFILVGQPWYRKVLSRAFNLFVRTILGLPFKDTQCGSKIFRRGVIDALPESFDVSGFAFDACLLYYLVRAGHIIKEHPIAWSDDRRSSLNVRKVGIDVFFSVIRVRLSRFLRHE